MGAVVSEVIQPIDVEFNGDEFFNISKIVSERSVPSVPKYSFLANVRTFGYHEHTPRLVGDGRHN